jgi:hypothetical protein
MRPISFLLLIYNSLRFWCSESYPWNKMILKSTIFTVEFIPTSPYFLLPQKSSDSLLSLGFINMSLLLSAWHQWQLITRKIDKITRATNVKISKVPSFMFHIWATVLFRTDWTIQMFLFGFPPPVYVQYTEDIEYILPNGNTYNLYRLYTLQVTMLSLSRIWI